MIMAVSTKPLTAGKCNSTAGKPKAPACRQLVPRQRPHAPQPHTDALRAGMHGTQKKNQHSTSSALLCSRTAFCSISPASEWGSSSKPCMRTKEAIKQNQTKVPITSTCNLSLARAFCSATSNCAWQGHGLLSQKAGNPKKPLKGGL